jgi:hypothetical protein
MAELAVGERIRYHPVVRTAWYVGRAIVVDHSLSRSPLSGGTKRLVWNALLATFGMALSIVALPASALAATSANQTAPETRPAINITSVFATLEGWLGSEQPEAPKAPKEGPQPEGPGGPKEPIAPSDPRTVPASWYFEYAPGGSCTGPGSLTTPEDVAMFKGVDEVGVTVTDLQPGTEYTACLVNWHTVLPSVSFTTLAEVTIPVTMGNSDNPFVSLLPVSATGDASKPKVTGKALLAKALKACERKPKRQRGSCDKQARKRYIAAQK